MALTLAGCGFVLSAIPRFSVIKHAVTAEEMSGHWGLSHSRGSISAATVVLSWGRFLYQIVAVGAKSKSGGKPRKEGVDGYIAAAAEEARPVLKKIRAVVKRAVPGATETISYRIPALRMGRVFFYYAAFKKHIGVYPPVRSDKKLVKELERYRGEKGNLQFPLDEPMPYELIGRVSAALAKEYGKVEGASKQNPKTAKTK